MYYDSVCIYAFMHQHLRGLLGTSQIPTPTPAQCLLAKNQSSPTGLELATVLAHSIMYTFTQT